MDPVTLQADCSISPSITHLSSSTMIPSDCDYRAKTLGLPEYLATFFCLYIVFY
jgi:hypothetical protein